MTDHHEQPTQDAPVLFPFPLTVYLHDGDLDPDPDQEWTEAELAFLRANALLDAVIDGPRRRDLEELVYLLGGPFGVEWRAGQLPIPAPATSWEPTVLELGHPVAEAMHLDPLWGDDPADYA
jgi:hypothetical protein